MTSTISEKHISDQRQREFEQVKLAFKPWIEKRCWFDEQKCSQGIRALENYRKEWNERMGTWNSQPKHDWASHGADAFRTLATSINRANTTKELPQQQLIYSGISSKHSPYGYPHSQNLRLIKK